MRRCGPLRLLSRCVLLFTAWCAGLTGRWVALCHADCWCACRVGGAWGLLKEPLSGWRRVFGIADRGLVAVLLRVAAGGLPSQNGSFLKGGLYRIVIFGVWLGSGLWRDGRACTESSFLAFGSGPGSGGMAGLVQNRHFWALVRVRALGRSQTVHFERPG